MLSMYFVCQNEEMLFFNVAAYVSSVKRTYASVRTATRQRIRTCKLAKDYTQPRSQLLDLLTQGKRRSRVVWVDL